MQTRRRMHVLAAFLFSTTASLSSCECGDEPLFIVPCAKLDIVFVVDNSLSMAPMQRKLVESFASFSDELGTTLKDADLHVMVVDSDATGYEERLCEEPCTGHSRSNCEGFVCGSLSDRDICDQTLGAGVVRPLGHLASNLECNFPDGRRFLQTGDEDFVERFQCAARVGTTGSGDEKLIGALLASLGESGDNGCNQGFLRDDAVLLVVLIGDPSHETSEELGAQSPIRWRDELVAFKGGDAERVVVASFIHDGSVTPPDGAGAANPYSACGAPLDVPLAEPPPGADDCWCIYTGDAPSLAHFTDLFGDNGTRADVCEDDYGALFGKVVSTVKGTCDALDAKQRDP